MEYLVLARKWRPQSFEHVVGQDHVVRTLKNAILQERIAHAFIFSGPRGVGKTSVARIMAKALNCEKGPGPLPCQVCTNCREITEGISIDVREIDGASNRGIDEIRELREHIRFAPVSSRYTIYIIDEVHMLTREAFNALLKTLEEPPAHVIFIFATTETHKVPATILSRCQCFDFRRISQRQLRENLKQIAEAEGIRVSDAGLTWIAEAGDGSLRDAQSIFDQAISYAGFDIKDSDVEELLGRTDRRFLFILSGAVLERDAGRCLRIIEESYCAGLDMKYFYQMLLVHFRNLLLARIAGREAGLFDLSDDELTALGAQADRTPRETLQRLLDMLMAEEDNVRKSSNPRLNLEALLVKMAYVEPLIPLDEFAGRMEELEKRLSHSLPGRASGLHIGKIADELAPYGERNSAGTGGVWDNFKNFVKGRRPPLGSKIEHGSFLGYEDSVLSIGFAKKYFDILDINGKSEKARLEELAREFFKGDVVVRAELIEAGEEELPNGGASRNRVNEIKADALNQPLLQKVLDLFPGAEVREIITTINDK